MCAEMPCAGSENNQGRSGCQSTFLGLNITIMKKGKYPLCDGKDLLDDEKIKEIDTTISVCSVEAV